MNIQILRAENDENKFKMNDAYSAHDVLCAYKFGAGTKIHNEVK